MQVSISKPFQFFNLDLSDTIAAVKKNYEVEKEKSRNRLSCDEKGGKTIWVLQDTKVKLKTKLVTDDLRFLVEQLTNENFKVFSSFVKTATEQQVNNLYAGVMGEWDSLRDAGHKKPKGKTEMREFFNLAFLSYLNGLHRPERSFTASKIEDVEDVEVKPAKVYQAGVDYPSLVIQEDGSHIFAWGEEVIILSKDEATDGAVTAIMQSSFDMFKANSKIFKEKSAGEEDSTKEDSTKADARVEELKEAITSIDANQSKSAEQTAMAAAISKAMGSDTLKAAAAEDRIHDAEERKTIAFSRVKRRNR